jgi:MSHA biogenesis protein MshE
MVLVTGPTGSGKTTTPVRGAQCAEHTERKIITVEDPVEYRLPGLNQVQVMEKIDLGFERVLRAALRQDPDVCWWARCATRSPPKSACAPP